MITYSNVRKEVAMMVESTSKILSASNGHGSIPTTNIVDTNDTM